ncbi:hypothetical protein [Virgibacillus chiguensis]|uniref:Uncharacterized protein n=1 Tax=Virgibacillus chiguensis TaxID=411959 RepID=A0A1M5WBS1_9BACI|nr:hypothetical protein [Virgibacillus chiguensis]SHH84900.1 hypothetical protein SAMN05421807_115107 [Virgibacillus chiguensis]
MKKLSQKLVFIILSLALVCANGFLNVKSTYAAESNNNLQQKFEETMDSVTEIENKEAKAKYRTLTTNLIKKNNLKINTSIIDHNNAKVYKTKNKEYTVYTAQIKSPNTKFHEISNLTVFYDKNNKIKDYLETQVKESSKGTFQISAFLNGKEVFNEITDDEFTTAEANSQNNTGVKPYGVNFGKIADCLGLSFSVAAGLGAVCGTVCVATAGTGCAICIGAYLGFDVSSVTACVVGGVV